MDFHGIFLKGPLIHEKVATLPTWTSADIGRQLYCEFDDKFYVGTSTAWKDLAEAAGSTGASGDIFLSPYDFSFDGDDPGSDAGIAFGISECIDFSPNVSGSVIANIVFPSSWDITKDVKFKLEYNLNGTDNAKNVKINLTYWVLNTNDTPNIASPSASGLTEYIYSDSTNMNKTNEVTLNTCLVTSANLTANTKSIVIKLTRDGGHGADSYGGTFQLLKVTATQI